MLANFRVINLLSQVPSRVGAHGAIFTSSRLYSDVKGVAAVAAAPAAGAREAEESAPLVDLHGRRHNYLRVSLTERCNLRCQYCMPAEGAPLSPRERLLSRAELARLVRVFAALGVDKIRLTGGEPTLRADLADIIQEMSAVPGVRTVAMTTNGLVLTRRLPALQRAGLAALNVSLDTLRPDRYEAMARRPGLSRVLAGIDLALQLGYRPLKVNTVLIKGFNDDEICDFVAYTKDREVEVRFIEFMPFAGNEWDDSRLVPYRAALRAIARRYDGLEPAPARPHDTARLWHVPGHAGLVGFVASMTQHFCGTCNRLRLTADGNLKVCLFGAAEVSLRDAMRAGADDRQLRRLVRAALLNKQPRHAGRYAKFGPNGKPTHDPHRGLGGWGGGARAYCTRAGPLSHLDAEGRARMVDVGSKPVTRRTAVAECYLVVSERLARLLAERALPKGDAATVAEVAGALAAKRAADLLPLCHPLPLECARARVHAPAAGRVRVTCEVRARARTGAEMEALTGCAVAVLALYDMCKSADRGMRVTDLRVVSKTGGRGGDWPPAPSTPSTPSTPDADG